VPYALSIDVGTTFTAAATWRDGRATTVTLGDRADAIPSVLFLRAEDDVLLVGDAAERRAVAEPSRVAREFKRRVGDEVPLLVGDRQFTPEFLTGHIIRWVVDHTCEREGELPAHVTLTCPASWGDYRRSMMTSAASTAGLDAVGLMTEPGAAATHYAARNRLEPGATVAVYDFGGGTFDAAVLRKTVEGFELCGPPGGDDEVGGTDFDAALLRLVAAQTALAWSSFDTEDPEVLAAIAQLRARVVDAKEGLSNDFSVDVPVMLPGAHRRATITRAQFEDTIRDQVLGTVDTLRHTIERADVGSAGIAAVLLVGGSSRIPLVAQLIESELGVPTLLDAHPKHAVCLGAAIGAATRIAPVPRAGTPPVAPPVVSPIATDEEVARRIFAQLPAAADSATDLRVDLVASGLTVPLDQPVALVPTPRSRLVVTSRDEPLVIRLDEPDDQDDVRRRRQVVVFVIGAVLLVVVLAVLGSTR
jgi:molecular chaperone DnaK